jgi:hypothetical protein
VAETRYYAHFFADYSDLAMQPNDSYVIFDAIDSSGFVLRVRQRGDGWVRITAFDNAGSPHHSDWIDHGIYEGDVALVLSWIAGSPGLASIGPHNGMVASITLENSTRRIEQARLGAVAAVPGTATGMLRLDTFGSWRDVLRGPGGICHPAAETTGCTHCCWWDPPGGEE